MKLKAPYSNLETEVRESDQWRAVARVAVVKLSEKSGRRII